MSKKKKSKKDNKIINKTINVPIQNEKKLFTFSNIISCLAFLVSLFSVVYTIFSDKMKHNEYLQFKTTEVIGDYESHLTEGSVFDEIAGYYTQFVDIIISNTSDKDTSITRVDSLLTFTKSERFYNSVIKGVDVPVNIKANESTKKRIEIRYPINKKSYNLLKEKFGEDAYVPFDQLQREIHKSQLDMFGNKINYEEYNNRGTYGFSYVNDESVIKPIIYLYITTSENNTFECKIEPTI